MQQRVLVLIGLLAVAGCSEPPPETTGYNTGDPPICHELSQVVKDDRPAFRIQPGTLWRMEFGRGSGWHGLDTVKLDQDGHLLLHRLKGDRRGTTPVLSWETATLDLPAKDVTRVLEAIEQHRLLQLHKAYHAAVADGTQWVLWIRQGDREKSVYCNNYFPEPILRFAAQLDEILAASAGPHLRWRPVPSAESRHHERQLWKSIKR